MSFGNKQATFGIVNTRVSSVVICTRHEAIMYVTIYRKILDMVCVDIWHHSGDVKASVQQYLIPDLTKNSEIT